MSCEGHLIERRLVGLDRQTQLEHADRLAAVRHRREETDAGGAVSLGRDGLPEKRAALRGAAERHAFGRLAALRALIHFVARCRRCAVIQADERTTAEIGDQERNLGRAEHGTQAARDRVHGVDRRCVLDRGQQLGEIEPATGVPKHAVSVDERCGKRGLASEGRRSGTETAAG